MSPRKLKQTSPPAIALYPANYVRIPLQPEPGQDQDGERVREVHPPVRDRAQGDD